MFLKYDTCAASAATGLHGLPSLYLGGRGAVLTLCARWFSPMLNGNAFEANAFVFASLAVKAESSALSAWCAGFRGFVADWMYLHRRFGPWLFVLVLAVGACTFLSCRHVV